MKVTGGCHCRHITYQAEVDPATVRVCHCTDCQKLTGTAFRATIASLPGTFVLKSGTPKTYIKTAESGNRRVHAFCPECGTPIYAAAAEPNPSTYGLRVGGIDQSRSTCRACASAMVPLGAALVDGSAIDREGGSAMTVTDGTFGKSQRLLDQTTGVERQNAALAWGQ